MNTLQSLIAALGGGMTGASTGLAQIEQRRAQEQQQALQQQNIISEMNDRVARQQMESQRFNQESAAQKSADARAASTQKSANDQRLFTDFDTAIKQTPYDGKVDPSIGRATIDPNSPLPVQALAGQLNVNTTPMPAIPAPAKPFPALGAEGGSTSPLALPGGTAIPPPQRDFTKATPDAVIKSRVFAQLVQDGKVDPGTPQGYGLGLQMGVPEKDLTGYIEAKKAGAEKPTPGLQHLPGMLGGSAIEYMVDPKSGVAKPMLDEKGSPIHPPPPASIQVMNQNAASIDPAIVNNYLTEIRTGRMLTQQVPKHYQEAVMNAGSAAGIDMKALTGQSQATKEFANTILPHIPKIEEDAAALQATGLVGPLAGRYRDFMSGKVGAMPGASPQDEQLMARFRADVGLMRGALMRVHGGARGAASPQMLAYVESMLNSSAADYNTFTGGLASFKSFIDGYAHMGENREAGGGAYQAPGSGPAPSSNEYDYVNGKLVKRGG